MNKTTQECEMDLLICFWDETDVDVKVKYLGSSFLGHAKAKDLSKQFKEITKSLVPTKIFKVSMDGPNVNLKFCEAMKQERKENLFHSPINNGTCSFYSVHEAIWSGVEATSWGIKENLKGALHLLRDFSARPEDFEVVTSSSKYVRKLSPKQSQIY